TAQQLPESTGIATAARVAGDLTFFHGHLMPVFFGAKAWLRASEKINYPKSGADYSPRMF
ncbi:hypothetical protein, partial [Thiolapillus sp.]|uniref:hypothetical protein n=1 Tax=Thiolapillus sp. TaxID=2017437 RepID=UPI003AF7BD2F